MRLYSYQFLSDMRGKAQRMPCPALLWITPGEAVGLAGQCFGYALRWHNRFDFRSAAVIRSGYNNHILFADISGAVELDVLCERFAYQPAHNLAAGILERWRRRSNARRLLSLVFALHDFPFPTQERTFVVLPFTHANELGTVVANRHPALLYR